MGIYYKLGKITRKVLRREFVFRGLDLKELHSQNTLDSIIHILIRAANYTSFNAFQVVSNKALPIFVYNDILRELAYRWSPDNYNIEFINSIFELLYKENKSIIDNLDKYSNSTTFSIYNKLERELKNHLKQ